MLKLYDEKKNTRFSSLGILFQLVQSSLICSNKRPQKKIVEFINLIEERTQKKDEKRKFQFDHTNDFYTNKRANKKNISTHLIL